MSMRCIATAMWRKFFHRKRRTRLQGWLYDYHTEGGTGIIQVIWDSVETVDYPEVNVLAGDET